MEHLKTVFYSVGARDGLKDRKWLTRFPRAPVITVLLTTRAYILSLLLLSVKPARKCAVLTPPLKQQSCRNVLFKTNLSVSGEMGEDTETPW